MRFEDEHTQGAEVVRSFIVTAGKATTAAHHEELALETRVTHHPGTPHHENFERKAIITLCTNNTLSVAEISAHLKLPTLSTIVLVTQLVNDGHLHAEEPVDEIDMHSLMLIRDAIRNL